MSLVFNTLSRFILVFLPRSKCLRILWLQSPFTVILEPKKIKSVTVIIFSPIYLPWCDGTGCHNFSVLNVEFSAILFTLLFHLHQEILQFFTFCYLGGVVCIYEVVDISRHNLHSSLWFIQHSILHDAYKLNKQSDNIQLWHTPFPIWNQSVLPCPVLMAASWPAYYFIRRQVRWSDILISLRISTVCCVSKALVQSGKQMFFWNSLPFSMIQRMLTIWSLVPLPFLNPDWTSRRSWFTYCWNLAWRVLSITLLACEISAIVR